MRIARFIGEDGRSHFGRLVEDRSARLLRGELFGKHEFESSTSRVVKFLPPVTPPNVFAIGSNYRGHAAETGTEIPDHPLVFLKATTAVTAAGAVIVLPPSAPDEVDFEAELAIVIGRRARRVAEADALDYVFGYTCANDVSARDCQKRLERQWARGKSFDTFCPLGPWIVTPDELDADCCAIASRLNGGTMQESNTSDLIFSCRALVSYLSHQFTLLPGTVILTGTPEGVGFTREPPVYLRDGDRIEVEIGGIGTLVNYVARERVEKTWQAPVAGVAERV